MAAARQEASLKFTCSVSWKVAGSWGVSQQGRQGQILADVAARCSHASLWSRAHPLGPMGVEVAGQWFSDLGF